MFQYSIRSLLVSVIVFGCFLILVMLIARARYAEFTLTHVGGNSIFVDDLESIESGDVVDRLLGLAGRTRFVSIQGNAPHAMRQLEVLPLLSRLQIVRLENFQSTEGVEFNGKIGEVQELAFSSCSSHFVVEVLANSSGTRNLVVNGCGGLTAQDLSRASNFRNLAQIYLTDCSSLIVSDLLHELAACKNMQCIEVAGCAGDIKETIAMLSSFKRLEFVSIVGEGDFFDVRSLQGLAVAKTLKLSNVDVDQTELQKVRRRLSYELICIDTSHNLL